MKSYIFIWIISIGLFSSCKELYTNNPTTDGVYILVDVSDSFPEVTNLSLDQIKPFMSVHEYSSHGATTWVAPITDLRYNPCHRISLENTNQLSENEFERNSSVDSFYIGIKAQIKQVQSLKPNGTNGSHVFFSMSKALKELASCENCTSKTLIVLGDLREYSSVFNSYDPIQFRLLKDSPKKIEQLIDLHYHIPTLKGINIYLVHEPISKMDDDAFHVMSSFLKIYLERKGAKVSIGSHLQS